MWQIAPQLESDSHLILDDENYQVRLLDDVRYNWVLLIPKVESAQEIYHLSAQQQLNTLLNINKIAMAFKDHFDEPKLNIAYLGNVVNQLHIHILSRETSDAAWPGPVWGHSDRQPMSKEYAEMACAEWHHLLTPKS